jgi:isoquinoline 1-oxidoreductase beta subunit
MGTGIRTSLPQVAADELEADWGRVTIEQGIGDARYGDQNTDGSRSIRDFYEAFRHATPRRGRARQLGGDAVAVLIECTAQNHEVVHTPNRLGYGAGAAAAKMRCPG